MSTHPAHIDGRYAVMGELGRGSMGHVLLVRDGFAGGVPYACKILDEPRLRDDFVAEFDLLRRLSHPGFVGAYRLGVDRPSRRPYAILELCHGASLADRPTCGPEEVVDHAVALLRALDHLHRLGYVHGDLAPVNVVFHDDEDAPVKLLDLGAGGRRGTRQGTTSGVLAYAAPERLRGAALAPTSDLWSLGCLLFERLHGRHPWPGYPARRGAEEPPDRAGLVAHAIDPVLDRLLQHDPAQRYPSAADALTELESRLDRDLPLMPLDALAWRLQRPPYHDAGGRLADLALRLRTAADARRPLAVDVAGAAGSGRTRLLAELADALAAHGIPSRFERATPTDAPGAPLRRLLAALGQQLPGETQTGPMLQALSRAAKGAGGPIALIVDELDRGTAQTRAVFDQLARTVTALPERFGGVLIVTAGGGRDDFRIQPWGTGDVARLLEALFPDRRVGARVAEPIRDAARGNASLSIDIVGSLLATGALVVDATAVTLADPAAVDHAAPRSREEAAAAIVGALPGPARRVAGILARSPRAVPAALLGPDADALLEAGAAARVPDPRGVRLTLRSEPMVRACEALVDADTAHAALARSWHGYGDAGSEARAAELWHRLARSDGANVIAEAAATLDELDVEDAATLVLAMIDRGWPEGDLEAALDAGGLLERTRRTEAALSMYRRAVDAASSPVDAARALARVGRVQAHQSRHAAALEALRGAIARGGAALDTRERAEIFTTMARSGALSGALEDAQGWCDEGLALAGDDATLRGRLGYSQGLLAWYRGELEVAEAAFADALRANRRVGDPVEEAAAVTGLGLIAHRRGDLDAALDRYREALALGERAGDGARVLTSLQNLGVVFHERGDWIAALDTYREALALAEALEHTGREVQLAGNLGNLWRYLGELDQAREVLQPGLELARREGNRYMEAILLNLLADVSSDAEQWELAERLWGDAIRATRQAQCATEEAEARLNLGRLFVERLAFADARASLEEALKIAERVANEGLASQARALLAAIERTSVDGDLGRARALMERARADLDEVPNLDNRWPILLEAARLCRDEGELDEATRLAREVRSTLQKQLDGVPARHRPAFQARRDRRRAWRETSAFHATAGRGGVGATRDVGWTRLLEINKRLATEHDVNRLLEYIMDSAILLTEAERGFLLLVDGEALEVRVARNLDQENIRKKHLKISYGIARRVIDSGEPVITIDAMEDARYRDQLSVHDLRLRSILCIPMAFRGRVLGAIYLDNRFRSSAFGQQDLPFMEAFGDLAGIALDNAQLLAARDKTQAALEKARREVEALNARLAEQLEARTHELEETHRVVIRQQRQLVARHQYERIIGDSPALRRVFAMMDRLLDNDVPVLIEGESGTGKELVARAIHFNGARQARPFVAVNCGAIPPTLLESELFGHVRGAFTNAHADKQGLFEAADTGTLLLDEIGELPLEMQVKLLRVLQSGEFKKVGSTKEITVDVRILAATNRELAEEVKAGRFREDLYYRLSVVPIRIPALRERREDIPLLVRHFLEANREAGLGDVADISKQALALLSSYAWPGNVRQLEMVLKNASVFAEGDTLQPHDFESFPEIAGHRSGTVASAALAGKSLAEIEREAIIVALRDNRGNKKRSAEQLGIDRRTLYNKLAAYSIVVDKALTVR